MSKPKEKACLPLIEIEPHSTDDLLGQLVGPHTLDKYKVYIPILEPNALCFRKIHTRDYCENNLAEPAPLPRKMPPKTGFRLEREPTPSRLAPAPDLHLNFQFWCSDRPAK